ncbi:MAG: hypothetical protein VW443_11980 [Pseudomonadales bacterium]
MALLLGLALALLGQEFSVGVQAVLGHLRVPGLAPLGVLAERLVVAAWALPL